MEKLNYGQDPNLIYDDSCGIVSTKVFAEERLKLFSSYLFHLVIGHKCQERVGINHGRFMHRIRYKDYCLIKNLLRESEHLGMGNQRLKYVYSTVGQTSN